MFSNSLLYVSLLAIYSAITNARPSPQHAPAISPQSFKSKRGLAYNSTSPSLEVFTPFANKITWGHDWYSGPFKLPDAFEFVATLTDTTIDSLPVWDQNVAAALARSSATPKYLMSFNEPDQPGSKAHALGLSDVGLAAAAYREHMHKHGSDTVKLGCPSVTNGVINGMGLTWLSMFLDTCADCIIDFVPVHWYGCAVGTCDPATDAQMFKDQMGRAMEAARGKPVWIPEFQRLGDLAGQKEFLENVLPWLDHPDQAQIERYAYFMVWDGFLTANGALNEVGLAYVA